MGSGVCNLRLGLIWICRPIGIVAGSVNKSGQTAKDIVDEIVGEALVVLKGASGFVNASAKL